LADLPEYRRLLIRIANELEEREVLEKQDIIRIANSAAPQEAPCST